jgi:NAD(P)-dependent dehydrogenase (short-subunit alcohol dehydrogenase family)
MKDLNNRVAVITGAGSGIGRALAQSLADRGCRLALSDVNEIGLAETAALCDQTEVRTYLLDVSDRDAIYAHADLVAKDFGAVNLVINNAGVALNASVREMTDEVQMGDGHRLLGCGPRNPGIPAPPHCVR